MLEKPRRIVAFGGDQFRHVLTSICDEKDHMPKKSDISDFFAYVDTKILFAKPWIT